MDTTLAINLIGWTGSILVILAYLLISFNRLKGDSLAYQILNLLSGIFLLVNTFYLGAYPSSMVNLVWMGIAITAILQIVRRSKK
jgi:hypothetical protein